MKNIFLISVISLFFNSCIKQETYLKTTVINNSGVTVDFIPYVNNVKDISKKVSLSTNNFLFKEQTEYQGNPGSIRAKSVLFPELFVVNKVEVVFNNSKKVIYEECSLATPCSVTPSNIFNSYDDKIRYYVITTQDYIDATDCGGNCN